MSHVTSNTKTRAHITHVLRFIQQETAQKTKFKFAVKQGRNHLNFSEAAK